MGIDPTEPLDTAGSNILGRRVEQPATGYLTGEENLRVTFLLPVAGSALTLNGRVLLPEGRVVPISEPIPSSGAGTLQTKLIVLPEGWLLGLTVRATSGAPAIGQAWVLLELVRGLSGAVQLVESLGMGFVTNNTPLIWPGTINQASIEGQGWLRSITGTTPAAGAEISETVPTGARWELLSLEAILVTSVAVANRVPALIFDDGANQYAKFPNSQATAASTQITICWAQGMNRFNDTSNAAMLSGLGVGNRLAAGHRLHTSTVALQAADQWSAVQYLVRQWATGE